MLCFKPTGRMRLGHVAVVSQVLTDRIIQISHANWSIIEGGRGHVEKNVTVIDVSPAGDWSLVKVWYDPSRDLGSTTYPTYGFIYQDSYAAAASKLAAAGSAAVTLAQNAANQVVAAVRPGAAPLQMLGQGRAEFHRSHRCPYPTGYRPGRNHGGEAIASAKFSCRPAPAVRQQFRLAPTALREPLPS